MARLCEFPGLIVPQAGVWGQGPQRTLSRSDQRKSSQGAKRYLTVNYLTPRSHLNAVCASFSYCPSRQKSLNKN